MTDKKKIGKIGTFPKVAPFEYAQSAKGWYLGERPFLFPLRECLFLFLYVTLCAITASPKLL
jgi:hypothetical protein